DVRLLPQPTTTRGHGQASSEASGFARSTISPAAFFLGPWERSCRRRIKKVETDEAVGQQAGDRRALCLRSGYDRRRPLSNLRVRFRAKASCCASTGGKERQIRPVSW